MGYQDFLTAHDLAHPSQCKDYADIEEEMAKRKKAAFAAFMTYLDTNHPRKQSSLSNLTFIDFTKNVWYLLSRSEHIKFARVMPKQ